MVMAAYKRRVALVLAGLIHAACSICPSGAMAQTSKLSPRELFLQQLRDQGKEFNAGLTYCFELCRNGKSQLVGEDFSFQNGDAVRIHVKTNFDGYAYIVLA